MELAKDEEVKEKVLEVAKTFFSSSTVTVNVLPAIALAAVSLFLAVGIIGLVAPELIPGGLPGAAGSSSNVAYGAPSPSVAGYGGSPASEYVEPASDEYGSPSADPAPSYDSQYRSVSNTTKERPFHLESVSLTLRLKSGKWVQRVQFTLDQSSGRFFGLIRGAVDLEDGGDGGQAHGGRAEQHHGKDDPVTGLPARQ